MRFKRAGQGSVRERLAGQGGEQGLQRRDGSRIDTGGGGSRDLRSRFSLQTAGA